MFLISGSYFSVFRILISSDVKKMPLYFFRDTWYICMHDLSFQELIVYPRLLLISFHGDFRPISQATQHMYHFTYFKIMYIQNDSQGLIHALGLCERIFNEWVSQNRESQPIVHNYFFSFI